MSSHLLIENASEVINRFGFWPKFGDDEVIALTLDRKSPSLIFLVKAIQYNQKNCILEFSCESVQKLIIENFNHQNVISELVCKREGDNVQVTLTPSFGVFANFICKKISVRVVL